MIGIIDIVITVIIAICTILILCKGLKNWRIDKSKEFYQDLRERKANLIETLNNKDTDENTKNYKKGEFLNDLELIAIMYYKNSIDKSLFKEIFFPLFKEIYENEDFKKIKTKFRDENATTYENFEKIYLENIYIKDTKYNTIQDIVLSIICCIVLFIICYAYNKYIA